MYRHHQSTIDLLKLMQASAKSLRAVAEQGSQCASSFPCTRMKLEGEAFDKHQQGLKKARRILDEPRAGLSFEWLMFERKSKETGNIRQCVFASGDPLY